MANLGKCFSCRALLSEVISSVHRMQLLETLLLPTSIRVVVQNPPKTKSQKAVISNTARTITVHWALRRQILSRMQTLSKSRIFASTTRRARVECRKRKIQPRQRTRHRSDTPCATISFLQVSLTPGVAPPSLQTKAASRQGIQQALICATSITSQAHLV